MTRIHQVFGPNFQQRTQVLYKFWSLYLNFSDPLVGPIQKILIIHYKFTEEIEAQMSRHTMIRTVERAC